MFEPERERLDFSPDQRAAWDAIAARLGGHGVDLSAGTTTPRGDASGADVLAVMGKAGSGKTVLLAELARRLEEMGLLAIRADWEPRIQRHRRSFAILAPTNKAASVLRGHGVPATTIHRIIYTPVYDPEYEKLADWLEGTRKTRPAVSGLAEAALERALAFCPHPNLLRGSQCPDGATVPWHGPK